MEELANKNSTLDTAAKKEDRWKWFHPSIPPCCLHSRPHVLCWRVSLMFVCQCMFPVKTGCFAFPLSLITHGLISHHHPGNSPRGGAQSLLPPPPETDRPTEDVDSHTELRPSRRTGHTEDIRTDHVII